MVRTKRSPFSQVFSRGGDSFMVARKKRGVKHAHSSFKTSPVGDKLLSRNLVVLIHQLVPALPGAAFAAFFSDDVSHGIPPRVIRGILYHTISGAPGGRP